MVSRSDKVIAFFQQHPEGITITNEELEKALEFNFNNAVLDVVRDVREAIPDIRYSSKTWTHRPPPPVMQRVERNLNAVTIEEYIEATGGMASFLEGLNDFAKENGFDWLRNLQEMMTDVEQRARMFRRIGVIR